MDETMKSQGKILRSVHTHKSMEQCHNNKMGIGNMWEESNRNNNETFSSFLFCHTQKTRIIPTTLSAIVINYILQLTNMQSE